MAQDGELIRIYKKGHPKKPEHQISWAVRYYEGKKRRMKTLGTVVEYPGEDDIKSAFQAFMSEVNATNKIFVPSAGTLVRSFVIDDYFPKSKDLRGSTLRGYKAIWNNYIEPRLGHLRVRDIRTFDCQNVMDAIVDDNPELKKASLARIKSFMSAIFNEAIRRGLRKDDKNPVASDKSGNGGIKIRGRRNERKTETYAYSLDDIKAILSALTEPSRVLMAVAAYTGLRRGEIVGLKWEDYDGDNIHVRRNICFGERGEMTVELPKTEASEASVPVIKPLKAILDAWKSQAEVTEGCWIFQAGFTRKKDHPVTLLDAGKMTPLSPANVLRDVVLPALEKAEIEWHGYHAFRRGLATNLRALNVDDLTIKDILRHSDVAVTRASYIKRVDEKSVEAMDRFEAELRKPAKGVQRASSKDMKDTIVPTGVA
jgi:integrase